MDRLLKHFISSSKHQQIKDLLSCNFGVINDIYVTSTYLKLEKIKGDDNMTKKVIYSNFL